MKLQTDVNLSVSYYISVVDRDIICTYFYNKAYRVAMFAAYNKFLRIYHSKVSAVLKEYEAMN